MYFDPTASWRGFELTSSCFAVVDRVRILDTGERLLMPFGPSLARLVSAQFSDWQFQHLDMLWALNCVSLVAVLRRDLGSQGVTFR